MRVAVITSATSASGSRRDQAGLLEAIGGYEKRMRANGFAAVEASRKAEADTATG